jgi:hypothetical protein
MDDMASRIAKILEMYRAGAVTEHEFHALLLEALEPQSLPDFLLIAPSEVVENLHGGLDAYPTTDRRTGRE